MKQVNSFSTRLKPTAFSGCIVVLAMVMAGTAFGDERAVTAGQNCQPAYRHQQGDVQYTHGGTRNYAASARDVACPLVRQNPYSPPISANISVVDVSDTENLRCCFVVRDVSGSFWQTCRYPDEEFSSGVQTIEFGGIPDRDFDYYYYYCRIPGVDSGRVSMIRSMYLREP